MTRTASKSGSWGYSRDPMADTKPRPLILITGRSTTQGKSLHLGKESREFLDEVLAVQMNPEDMEKRGLQDGAEVLVRSAYGEMRGRCRKADLPPGMVFISYSYFCNQLIGGDTGGTGMPDSKGIRVEVEVA